MAGGRHDVLLRHGRCTEQGGEREAETARSDRPAAAQGPATAVRVAAATIPQPNGPSARTSPSTARTHETWIPIADPSHGD